MNNTWKQHLANTGVIQPQMDDMVSPAAISDCIRAIETADSNDVICDLSYLDTLVIAGNDAVDFMQGQFTNDVKLVDDQHSQLSAFCNKKGRMLANFRLFQYQGNHFISLNSTLTGASIDHLQHYVLNAHVAIQDVSDQLIHFGVSGDNATELLSPYMASINPEVDSVSSNDDYIFIRVAGIKPRYEIFCAPDKAITLWNRLAEQASIVDGRFWDYLNIQNGLPLIDSNTAEAFVPQMANMELINGVSFTKGCYTGQEIIARTHYLGKQKRRTYRLRIETSGIPKAGQQLTSSSAGANQYTGTLISVYPVADHVYEALAVIQMKSIEESLQLDAMDASISLLELPYSLQQDDADSQANANT